ncbi:hypothetical protein ACQ4M3_32075 [Leptolyngbya sp. AN03gr2]|uniref:hypothetical protein n=1 Tax=unclassified Leptolyngbya TaxID=2650499 RepID=UPI003D319FB0
MNSAIDKQRSHLQESSGSCGVALCANRQTTIVPSRIERSINDDRTFAMEML